MYVTQVSSISGKTVITIQREQDAKHTTVSHRSKNSQLDQTFVDLDLQLREAGKNLFSFCHTSYGDFI